MAKEHKYHRSRIEIDTALPVARLLDLARQTGESQRSVTVLGADAESVAFVFRNVFGVKLLTFAVHAREASGRTHGTTELLSYQTSQSTVFFIPVGPKLIEGYGEYRRYVSALKQVVEAADPSARCTVIEREDG